MKTKWKLIERSYRRTPNGRQEDHVVEIQGPNWAASVQFPPVVDKADVLAISKSFAEGANHIGDTVGADIVTAARAFCVAHRENYAECLNSDSVDIDPEFMVLCHAVFGPPLRSGNEWIPNRRHWMSDEEPADKLLHPNEEPIDDSVKCCPDCERPNQFGELCQSCISERQAVAPGTDISEPLN